MQYKGQNTFKRCNKYNHPGQGYISKQRFARQRYLKRQNVCACFISDHSLHSLEWDVVTQQVACFARTSMASRLILEKGLIWATSPQEANQLQQQTQEASDFPLLFQEIIDISPAIEAVQDGKVLNAMQLNAVVVSLEKINTIYTRLKSAQACPQLQQLSFNLSLLPYQMIEAVRYCVDKSGTILDIASKKLAKTRQERRENMTLLRQEIEAYAQLAHDNGVSERAMVVIRRDRLCIPVKNGRQSFLSKGSMQLDVSGSGSTVYMEPASVVDYNNFEAVLKSEEEEEELIVLSGLSQLMAKYAQDILVVLECITQLDVVYARAKHAHWMGSKRPMFVDNKQEMDGYSIDISQVRHPILLQHFLPDLPDLASQFSMEDNFMEPLNGSSFDQTVKKLRDKKKPAPEPIDIHIPADVEVVTVTGPNTGGKTAMLKTLGLCVLMAKAGLFLPVQYDERTPRLVWFDKVLADIGDGQSLQQNLSTFSSHLRWIATMFKQVGSQSLVLLDEVGSGTNPQEGAALAASVLLRLKGCAKLTIATTHHSELKELADKEENFINASVQFDVQTLQPLYTVTWGSSGSSNALAIAKLLNFDRSVLDTARVVLGDLKWANQSKHELVDSESLVSELEIQLKSAQNQVNSICGSSLQTQNNIHNLQFLIQQQNEKLNTYKLSQDHLYLEKLQQKCNQGLEDYEDGKVSFLEMKQILNSIDCSAPSERIQSLKPSSHEDNLLSKGIVVGDKVKVVPMMNKVGTVIAVGSSNCFVVKVGALTSEVNRDDLSLVLADRNKVVDRLSNKTRTLGNKQEQCSTNKSKQELTVQTSANTINVIGMEGFQATLEVERYISSIHVPKVLFIVHGVGGGNLKKELHQWLKNCPLIDSFCIESNSQSGITQVKLK
eukprot:TRINITY_DN27245_c0_g1_i2.p1 TRINITY_DN27245_c0_g1~~TRINITY_DN27245_c0_g1_i2.p1  ORF type:complete len:892 (+),score=59.81 TRINITY_DN27245_c0_g1_i2:109-2784(+)